jgi:hypothetical protein
MNYQDGGISSVFDRVSLMSQQDCDPGFVLVASPDDNEKNVKLWMVNCESNADKIGELICRYSSYIYLI